MVPRKTIQKSFKRGFQKERGFHPAPVFLVIVEDMTIAEGVVRHEQIPCIAFVIEGEGEITHLAVQIVALTDDIIGKSFLRIKFSHVVILGVGERIITCTFVVSIVNLALIFRQLAVFYNLVECIFPWAALAIPFSGEALIILKHELGILFVIVQQGTYFKELLVAVECFQIQPSSVQ